jgi:site-specific recombinase XerD
MRLPVTSYPAGGPKELYLAGYKQWLGQQAITPNTLRVYHSRIKQFLNFLEYGNLSDPSIDDPESLKRAMRLYLDFLKKAKRGNVTINANINALKNFSQFLGLAETELKRERRYRKAAKLLSIDEQKTFLRSVEQQESPRDRALALTLLYTGLRIGDCARLNIGDLAAGITCICLPNEAKLPLNDLTSNAMRQWLEARQKLPGAEAASALWVTNDGQRLSISGITFVVKRIGWEAKLTVSAELLRRTCLANAHNNLDRKELASRFGGYMSSATFNRFGMPLPLNSAAVSEAAIG